MADMRATLRLMAWLSPAFPVGAFSYSSGLEAAIASGRIRDAGQLADWIETLARSGSIWTDLVFAAEAWRRAGDSRNLLQLNQLALAMASSRSRFVETTAQGDAFAAALATWGFPVGVRPVAYAVAVGAAAGRHGLPLNETLAVFLQSVCTGLHQAAIRLGLFGQRAAVALLADFEEAAAEIAAAAASAGLEDIGGFTPLADIMSMNHDLAESRIFRS